MRGASSNAFGADAVIVTAARQFPHGRRCSAPERRAALVEWAEEGERLIIEDDYDAELRYDGVAVGALQGLAPEHVRVSADRRASAWRRACAWAGC